VENVENVDNGFGIKTALEKCGFLSETSKKVIHNFDSPKRP